MLRAWDVVSRVWCACGRRGVGRSVAWLLRGCIGMGLLSLGGRSCSSVVFSLPC